jgi:hypothetical protein
MSVLPCTTYKTLTIAFATPDIPPSSGYIVKWRPVGTTNWNTVTQNQNPITIAGVPGCYNIEGTIQANCGDGNVGSIVNFAVTSSSTQCRTVQLTQSATYTYTECGTTQPVTITNSSTNPTTLCVIDGSVSGGAFIDSNQPCV